MATVSIINSSSIHQSNAVDFEEDGQTKLMLLTTTSWLCGISYTILFGGSMAFQCVVNYMN